jgi:hypothetical protein
MEATSSGSMSTMTLWRASLLLGEFSRRMSIPQNDSSVADNASRDASFSRWLNFPDRLFEIM